MRGMDRRRLRGERSSIPRVAVIAGTGWRAEVLRASLEHADVELCDSASADVVVLVQGAVGYDGDLRRIRRDAVVFSEFPVDARRGEVHLLPSDTTPAALLTALRSPRRVPRQRTAPSSEPSPNLSPRERQVLAYLSTGHTNAQIASALDMSPNTARTHVQNLLSKMQAPNRAAAVAFAHRRALI